LVRAEPGLARDKEFEARFSRGNKLFYALRLAWVGVFRYNYDAIISSRHKI
jgi:hypothetical protein